MTLDTALPDDRTLRSRHSPETGRRWPLARVFTVGASVAASLALVAVALAASALWRLQETSTALADVATPALVAGQQVAVALLDQESGVRGFGATGRPDFLEPYRTGLAAQQAAMARLRATAAQHGLDDIVSELDAVDRTEQRWRALYAQPVVDEVATPDPDLGRRLFGEVRAATSALVGELEAQRAAARDRMASASGFLAVTGAAVTAVLVVLLIATGVGLRRGVLRPMSDLAAQVREVMSGSVQRAVHAGGPREIAELGEDVEAMRRHILRDLDEAQAANRRLDEQARELERSNRDLEQFAYVASHDLQEPLRKISSFCQLLQRRYAGRLDERADQYIAFAVDGATRMQRLINDLLAFSRVGRTTETFTAVDLRAVADAAAAQLEEARAYVDGQIVLAAVLPVVRGDASLLQVLFVNLLGNGLRFHRDGVPPIVRVEARRANNDDRDDWEITVSDNGIGIEPEYGEKIFVIFQRLHGRDAYPGTGIGLALAKRIVEFHGGRIGLADSPGPGATVRFTLPARPREETPT